MSLLTNEVREKTDQIAETILKTSFWSRYQHAEQEMLANPQIMELFTAVKKKQEARSKLGFQLIEHPKLEALDQEVEDLLSQLEQFPEVASFQDFQNELGECLSGITRILGWSVEGLPFSWETPGAKTCDLPPR